MAKKSKKTMKSMKSESNGSVQLAKNEMKLAKIS
jgi:hypothetical protein